MRTAGHVQGLAVIGRNWEFVKIAAALMVASFIQAGLFDIEAQYLLTLFGFAQADFAALYMLLGIGMLFVQVRGRPRRSACMWPAAQRCPARSTPCLAACLPRRRRVAVAGAACVVPHASSAADLPDAMVFLHVCFDPHAASKSACAKGGAPVKGAAGVDALSRPIE